jgi:isoleucyl-tRNA synthetase
LVLAESLVDKCLERFGLTGQVLATAKGAQLGGLNFRHPLHDLDAGYKRLSPVYLAEYVSDSDGTGLVHSSPAYGVDDFNSCIANGLKYDDILNPVQGNGTYAEDFPLFGGLHIWKAIPVVLDALRKRNSIAHHMGHDDPRALIAVFTRYSGAVSRASSSWQPRAAAARSSS